MKNNATKFLKAALIILAIPVLAFLLLVLPKIGREGIQRLVEGPIIATTILAITLLLYLSALPFFAALFQANKLLNYIQNEEAFSDLSVQALHKIKRFAFTISGLYLISLPLFYILAEWDDAPGLLLIGCVFLGASLVIGIFANVLALLLEEAIRMKNEIDLTV